MLRKLLRFANPEIALGFVVAPIFWLGILGWQAAYAPSEVEKRQCEDSAYKTGFKKEEYKTVWERTTTHHLDRSGRQCLRLEGRAHDVSALTAHITASSS